MKKSNRPSDDRLSACGVVAPRSVDSGGVSRLTERLEV